MLITLTYNDLFAFKPCVGALEHINKWDGRLAAAQARDRGISLEDALWVAIDLASVDADVARRLRLCLADFAAHVLHVYERKNPGNTAPRDAIIALRQYARGEVGVAALRVASNAAWAAVAWASSWAAGDRDAERKWQYDRLVAWMSDEEPEDWPLPDRAAGKQTTEPTGG